MKAKEIRAMSEQELKIKTIELRKELMKINSQIAIGTLPKSPGKIKEMKKTIAKILSVKNEKSRPAKSLEINKKNQGGHKKE